MRIFHLLRGGMTIGNSDVAGINRTRGFRRYSNGAKKPNVRFGRPACISNIKRFYFRANELRDYRRTKRARPPTSVKSFCAEHAPHTHSPNVSRPCTRIPAAAAKCFLLLTFVLCAARALLLDRRLRGTMAGRTGYRVSRNAQWRSGR